MPHDLTHIKPNDYISFDYVNHAGVHASRRVHIISFAFGVTPHHDEHQAFVHAWEEGKGMRTFAARDMKNVVMLWQGVAR